MMLLGTFFSRFLQSLPMEHDSWWVSWTVCIWTMHLRRQYCDWPSVRTWLAYASIADARMPVWFTPIERWLLLINIHINCGIENSWGNYPYFTVSWCRMVCRTQSTLKDAFDAVELTTTATIMMKTTITITVFASSSKPHLFSLHSNQIIIFITIIIIIVLIGRQFA